MRKTIIAAALFALCALPAPVLARHNLTAQQWLLAVDSDDLFLLGEALGANAASLDLLWAILAIVGQSGRALCLDAIGPRSDPFLNALFNRMEAAPPDMPAALAIWQAALDVCP